MAGNATTPSPAPATREDVAMIRGDIQRLTETLQAHLQSCAGRHGAIEPAMARYAEDFSRHGRDHALLETRLRRLEDESTSEAARRLHDRVREVEAWKTDLEKQLAAATAEKSMIMRLWPYLLTGASSAGVGAWGPQIWRMITGG